MSAPTLLLSRARVRRQVPAAALRDLLLPTDEGRRAGAGHRLVWTLFSDSATRERDFLWRETDAGVFLLLSRRPPLDRHGLFEIDEPKPFQPALAVGDRLAFMLRANATVAKKVGDIKRGKPIDVVMAAIRHLPPGTRAEPRATAVDEAGTRWLAEQGKRSGFAIASADEDRAGEPRQLVRVTSYRTLSVEHNGPNARIGVLDFEGVLEVREPAAFVSALGRGFGRAKAFGCGLMLIRRAARM